MSDTTLRLKSKAPDQEESELDLIRRVMRYIVAHSDDDHSRISAARLLLEIGTPAPPPLRPGTPD